MASGKIVVLTDLAEPPGPGIELLRGRGTHGRHRRSCERQGHPICLRRQISLRRRIGLASISFRRWTPIWSRNSSWCRWRRLPKPSGFSKGKSRSQFWCRPDDTEIDAKPPDQLTSRRVDESQGVSPRVPHTRSQSQPCGPTRHPQRIFDEARVFTGFNRSDNLHGSRPFIGHSRKSPRNGAEAESRKPSFTRRKRRA